MELLDSYQIVLSEDAIEDYLQSYQPMVAARQQDLARLKEENQRTQSVILTIDGLQPEKGHETLYVLRELRRQRVWFAEALLSSTTDEIQRVIVRARKLADDLGRPVRLWTSHSRKMPCWSAYRARRRHDDVDIGRASPPPNTVHKGRFLSASRYKNWLVSSFQPLA